MTVQRPAYLQNVGNVYAAEEMRRHNKFLANGRPGVNGVGDYAVSQFGTPNMSVNIAAGEALVNGSETVTQGIIYVYNDATVNRTIAASDATNPRRDLVVVRVRDQFYSGTFNDADVIVVTGTPAPSPVDPAAPANSLILARVAVAANATTITNANITDLRMWQAQLLYPGPNGLHIRNSGNTADTLLVDDFGGVYPRGPLGVPASTGGATAPSSYGTVPVKIDERSPGGPTANVVFSSIPQGFRHLWLKYHARCDGAGYFFDLQAQFNGDTGANYGLVATVNTGAAISATSAFAQTSTPVGILSGASRSAGGAGQGMAEILDYRSTVWGKGIVSQSHEGDATTGGINARNHWGIWNPAVAAAITSILLQPTTGNFLAGSQFALYGIP